MKKKKKIFLLAFSALFFVGAHNLTAQVTIGSEQEPNTNALLDLKENTSGTATKGLLLPRVELSSTTAASPLTAHVAGMTIYNTATTTGTNNVTPGVYYNDGTQWIRQQEAVEIDTRMIVYVDTTDPNSSAAGFSFNTPESGEFVNNDALKASSSYIYISTDGRTWYYNGNAYISYTQPTVDATAWYVAGTTNDAGANKTSAISRYGLVEARSLNGNTFAQLAPSGAIELCRTADAGANTVNGAIDFKKDPTADHEARIYFDSNRNNFYMTNGSATVYKPSTRLGLGVSGGYVCKGGASGVFTSDMFNILWWNSIPVLYINDVNVGQISTTSDRRLKENITPLKATALNRVMQLKPVSFNYKNIEGSIFSGSDKTEEGFVADELQEIIPSAVSGEKDALTESGDIQPQTLNWAPIVSVLTKAMQEQQELIETLLKRIETLEAKAND